MSFTIFFFVLLARPTLQASDLITQTCEKTLYKELCKSAQGSSNVKDMQSLAEFAIKITSLSGSEVNKHIALLLMNESSDKFSQQCLTDCSEMCQEAMDQLKDWATALNSCNYKQQSKLKIKATNVASNWVKYYYLYMHPKNNEIQTFLFLAIIFQF
ncbi:hypothetical protein P3X46_024858 [Hevea brasiliensis]|uniref:Pectinesterase inhibitor domain-containing protein n=1 Tax=Hevea brasiliensis TaxID=3981 RepID=A0ABQ9L3T9_HEVBR|nr:hypothetical protein P3X46_024858 [Hevea brasiliensis]